MQFGLLHPADQILLIMERIYRYGMTTTSGGNLSIMDDNGDIWITPAGVDKGALTRSDIVCVKPDGEIVGNHKPSSEFPFHQLVYRTRPDLKAVVHAHPPALVAFSIVRRIPDTRLLPNEGQLCGEIGMAPYALPGSVQLGENIAAVFAEGKHTVMLENHGVVVGGHTLFDAFKIFETLDFCARLEINAERIGKPILLSSREFELVRANQDIPLASFVPQGHPTAEREARSEMCKLIRRSYDQRLFTSTQGTFSQRLEGNSFLITPYGLDRNYLDEGDLVRIENGQAEEGKRPSRSVHLHQAIYDRHPHINSVLIAHPPNIMAFAVTETVFDSRTIPESYILLRRTPKLPFSAVYSEPAQTAELFTKDNPIAFVSNNCVIVTGSSLLMAFDRLEVAEYSAKSIIDASSIGRIVHIDDEKIHDIDIAFKL
ncbi:class II aldolase/adducin family protein [Paenibacillus sambharensis]|uniref:Class II aldolase/adducin family protein n=1 Tax=Paenibacillus sambharensis TaxID=1803190 RepID=A0A2W1LMU7_9BACL|nr:class II aldolase/adducin family protein [Paenibacillus sambharensis]PZD96312.1 class II aldolase/adducin family protein [Paenibacillus sambharensis]